MAIAGTGTANQPPPLEGYDLFRADAALLEGLRREGGAPWAGRVAAFGQVLGGEPLEWGRLANEHPPVLRTHDRYGDRDRRGRVPPGLARAACGSRSAHGVHALAVARAAARRARRARGAVMLLAQVEAGVGCPLSMTYAAVPALRQQPDLAAEWEPR